jgi:hypothetical protein
LQPISTGGTDTIKLPTIELHDFGDVTPLIRPEENSQPVLVSIATLHLASTVWKVMFEPYWAEGKASGIPFPDDDVDVVLLVLRIAHFRIKVIFKNLSF